jgi:hypothetical protein
MDADRTSALGFPFVIAVLFAVAGMQLGTAFPRADVTSALSSWRLDARQTERLRNLEAARLARLPEAVVIQPLATAFMELNLVVEAEPGKLSADDVARLRQRLSAAVEKLMASHGPEAFVAAGAWLAAKFEDALTAVAGKLESASEPAADWLAAHKDDADVHALRALSSDFIEWALSSGLLQPGRPPDHDAVAVSHVLFLQGWLAFAGSRSVPALSPDEQLLVLKWKVESAQHLPVERKLQLAAALTEADGDYPEPYVRGVLLAAAGRTGDAFAAFLECLTSHTMSRQARDWIVHLRRTEGFFQ